MRPDFAPEDCPHPTLRLWPALGPWWDYMCEQCGQEWRVPWRDSDADWWLSAATV